MFTFLRKRRCSQHTMHLLKCRFHFSKTRIRHQVVGEPVSIIVRSIQVSYFDWTDYVSMNLFVLYFFFWLFNYTLFLWITVLFKIKLSADQNVDFISFFFPLSLRLQVSAFMYVLNLHGSVYGQRIWCKKK